MPQPSIVIRVLLPLLIFPLLEITSIWRAAGQALHDACQAIEDKDTLEASNAIIRATQYFPWRDDLWEQAGILALESGQHDMALELFQ